jgi:quercetin dioxygenase-like cupin family protein
MSKIQAVQREALILGALSPGMTRHLAFKGEGVLILRSKVEPGRVSGWHHHGDYTVYGYVVAGTARFESGPGGRDVISVEPGGFFSVPPYTVHREINPSSSEAGEVILFLRGTGMMVVNVADPDPA